MNIKSRSPDRFNINNRQHAGGFMYSQQTQSPLVMTSMDHHVAAAEHHEEAAESHRKAAALYAYGDYQQAAEHARLAKGHGQQAEECCALAME